jgi:hypothetical protein
MLLSASVLSYRYYQGDWTSLPNFAGLTPVKSGLTDGFDLSIRNQDTDYAFVWTGYIDIPKTGAYQFYLNSDDGSAMYIDGQQIVDNDGVHTYSQASGGEQLTAGEHKLEVDYFVASDAGQDLSVLWSGPGIVKAKLPTTVLSPTTPTTTLEVSSFGAVGNGTTNDEPAIQNAINSAPDGSTLDLDAGKTYLLDSGLNIDKPINIEGNGATLLLDTSAYPENETVYFASPLAAASYTWTQTIPQGWETLDVAVSPTVIMPGDTVFVQLGTDPNDSTQPNWAEVCQVVSNTGSAITINIPVPYAISQGTNLDSIQRITDVVQNTTFDDVNFNFVSGTTPDANLWLNMARNVTISNLTGQFNIMANITDSQDITETGANGSLNQLDSSSGRMVSGWQDDGLSITNNVVTTDSDAPVVFLESWCRNTTISDLTVNWNYADSSSQDVFHFTGNSYNTTVTGVTINNVGAVNLVESGDQPAEYSFGTVTINGPVESAPLPAISSLTTGGQTYAASSLVTTTINIPIKSNWNDYQVPLCSGVIQSMSFDLSSLTGVNGLYVTNSDGGGTQLIGSLVAGQTDVLPQGFGTDYPLNDPAYPQKTLSFYTGSNVAHATTLAVTVTYYPETQPAVEETTTTTQKQHETRRASKTSEKSKVERSLADHLHPIK